MYGIEMFGLIDDNLVTIDLVIMSMVDKEHYSLLNDRIRRRLYDKRMRWNCCDLDFGLQFRNEELWIRAAKERDDELRPRNARVIRRI